MKNKPYHRYLARAGFFSLILATLYFASCRPIPIVQVNVNDGTEYVQLGDEIASFGRIINDTLAFVYDEEYNVTSLQYRIYANDGNLLYSNADRAVNIHYGRNYIQLYLPSNTAPFNTWLGKSPLLLEVTNAKQRKQYLTFNYTQ